MSVGWSFHEPRPLYRFPKSLAQCQLRKHNQRNEDFCVRNPRLLLRTLHLLCSCFHQGRSRLTLPLRVRLLRRLSLPNAKEPTITPSQTTLTLQPTNAPNLQPTNAPNLQPTDAPSLYASQYDAYAALPQHASYVWNARHAVRSALHGPLPTSTSNVRNAF